MIEHLCFGYHNVRTQETIAQDIIKVLKTENKPMKCMEITLAITDKDGYGWSCQKISAVLKKMVAVNAIKRIETILDETIEVGSPTKRKTVNLKDVRFVLVD